VGNKAPLPRWLLITLAALAVIVLGAGLFFLFRWSALGGYIVAGVLVAILVILGVTLGPHLYKLYKFNKYFKQHEDQLKLLPNLLAANRTQEAVMRFEGVMKEAPENAYMLYFRAIFLQRAGKLSEAMNAANRALVLAKSDPMLPAMLQEMKGQYGQPSTVEEFKEQLEQLRSTLEPRVTQMRQRREKAVEKRKKKSR